MLDLLLEDLCVLKLLLQLLHLKVDVQLFLVQVGFGGGAGGSFQQVQSLDFLYLLFPLFTFLLVPLLNHCPALLAVQLTVVVRFLTAGLSRPLVMSSRRAAPSIPSPRIPVVAATLLSAVLRMVFIHLLEERPLETLRYRLQMHVIAVASSLAAPLDELLALRIREISHRRVFRQKDLAIIISISYGFHALDGILFPCELDINVAKQVIADVVADNEIFNFSIVCKLDKYFFVEVFEVLYRLNHVFF